MLTSFNQTILPAWIDEFIYSQLHAIYSPDNEKFMSNTNLNEEEQNIYLGTYFPRSYGEVYCILNNLFLSPEYMKAMQVKTKIKILDIGCGNGGDLTGLLCAIIEKLPQIQEIELCIIDACKSSLQTFKELLKKLRAHHENIKIKCHSALKNFHSTSDLKRMPIQHYAPFDFILSNKIGGELLQQGQQKPYYDLCDIASPLLAETGIFLILDVTIKDCQTEQFYPQIMNFQINSYLKKNPKFKTLLPLSCNCFEKICNQPCFTQQIFYIHHSHKHEDLSKVAYRIIASRLFVDSIASPPSEDTLYCINKIQDTHCIYSNGKNKKDSYNLNFQ